MKFTVEFSTDNDAFRSNETDEVLRALHSVSRQIQSGLGDGIIFDSNGNAIGRFFYSGEELAQRYR